MFLTGTTLGLLKLKPVIICVTNPFSNLMALSTPSIVTLPNGKSVHVTHAGTIIVNNSLALYGALYIPSFRYNLLSVNKLSSQLNGYIIFTPQHCLMPVSYTHLTLPTKRIV